MVRFHWERSFDRSTCYKNVGTDGNPFQILERTIIFSLAFFLLISYITLHCQLKFNKTNMKRIILFIFLFPFLLSLIGCSDLRKENRRFADIIAHVKSKYAPDRKLAVRRIF